MKKGSFILVISLVLIVFVGIYSAYLFWQKSGAEKELRTAENTIKTYREELLQRDNEKLIKAIASKETANVLKSELIKWSEVIKKIRKTIPEKSGVPIIGVLSYSGSSNKDISLNVKTLPDSEKPYFDVADLIKAFDESEGLFADTFVGSISAGTDEKGKEVLSFLLTTKYVAEKEEFESNVNADELGESITDVLDESLVR